MANVCVHERLLVGEAGDADSGAAAALRVELRRWCELRGALVGDGQNWFVRQDYSGGDHLGAVLELHASHSTGISSLRADAIEGGAKDLSVARYDHNVRTSRSRERRDHKILWLEADELLAWPGSGYFVGSELFGHAVLGDDDQVLGSLRLRGDDRKNLFALVGAKDLSAIGAAGTTSNLADLKAEC